MSTAKDGIPVLIYIAQRAVIYHQIAVNGIPTAFRLIIIKRLISYVFENHNISQYLGFFTDP